jgi:hypothetical protein
VAEFHKEEECHNDQWKQGRKHKMTSQKNLATESIRIGMANPYYLRRDILKNISKSKKRSTPLMPRYVGTSEKSMKKN